MKKRIFFLLTFTCLSMAVVFGQARISGVVTSAEDNAPLPGVTVLVQGTSIGVITDADGAYAINVPDDATALIFSFVGMTSREVMLEG